MSKYYSSHEPLNGRETILLQSLFKKMTDPNTVRWLWKEENEEREHQLRVLSIKINQIAVKPKWGFGLLLQHAHQDADQMINQDEAALLWMLVSKMNNAHAIAHLWLTARKSREQTMFNLYNAIDRLVCNDDCTNGLSIKPISISW